MAGNAQLKRRLHVLKEMSQYYGYVVQNYNCCQ